MTGPLVAQLDSVPESIEAFLALQETLAQTPEGGVATFLLALLLRRTDGALGIQCLSASVDASRLTQGSSHTALAKRDLSRIDAQLAANPGIPAAYVRGAEPANAYALPDLPWMVEMTVNPYSGDPSDGAVKLFVVCSGADSPRPVTVRRQENGLWKPYEWSSLLMGIRPPAVEA